MIELNNIVRLKTKNVNKKQSPKSNEPVATCLHIRNKNILATILHSDVKQLYGTINNLHRDVVSLIEQDMMCLDGRTPKQTYRLNKMLEMVFALETVNHDIEKCLGEYSDFLASLHK